MQHRYRGLDVERFTLAFMVVAILATLAFWGSVAFVTLHFITKWW